MKKTRISSVSAWILSVALMATTLSSSAFAFTFQSLEMEGHGEIGNGRSSPQRGDMRGSAAGAKRPGAPSPEANPQSVEYQPSQILEGESVQMKVILPVARGGQQGALEIDECFGVLTSAALKYSRLKVNVCHFERIDDKFVSFELSYTFPAKTFTREYALTQVKFRREGSSREYFETLFIHAPETLSVTGTALENGLTLSSFGVSISAAGVRRGQPVDFNFDFVGRSSVLLASLDFEIDQGDALDPGSMPINPGQAPQDWVLGSDQVPVAGGYRLHAQMTVPWDYVKVRFLQLKRLYVLTSELEEKVLDLPRGLGAPIKAD